MFEDLRKKFHEIAAIEQPTAVIKGPKEIMALAKEIGASNLTDEEKEFFFDSLKDECLAEFGHVTEKMFNETLDKIERKRSGKA